MISTKPHRILSIPELINEIFGFLDDASNARNARVSRQWHEIALDSLWHDVKNLYHLFNCLSPLEMTPERCYVSQLPLDARIIFRK